VSNLKQLGLSLKMYANESEGNRFPPLQHQPPGHVGLLCTPLCYALYPEYLTDPAVYVCPSSAKHTIEDMYYNDDTTGVCVLAKEKPGGGTQGWWQAGFSYAYLGWVMDKLNDDDVKQDATGILGLLSMIPSINIEPGDFEDVEIPVQFVEAITKVLMGGPNLLESDSGQFDLVDPAVFNVLDGDIRDMSRGFGNGGPSGDVVYRLQEGVERFLVYDVADTGGSEMSQSDIWVMFDLMSSNADDFNHVPGGSNVLYMDGHVSFQKYPGTRAPVTKSVALAMSVAQIAY